MVFHGHSRSSSSGLFEGTPAVYEGHRLIIHTSGPCSGSRAPSERAANAEIFVHIDVLWDDSPAGVIDPM
jgi:hypothetical protein